MSGPNSRSVSFYSHSSYHKGTGIKLSEYGLSGARILKDEHVKGRTYDVASTDASSNSSSSNLSFYHPPPSKHRRRKENHANNYLLMSTPERRPSSSTSQKSDTSSVSSRYYQARFSIARDDNSSVSSSSLSTPIASVVAPLPPFAIGGGLQNNNKNNTFGPRKTRSRVNSATPPTRPTLSPSLTSTGNVNPSVIEEVVVEIPIKRDAEAASLLSSPSHHTRGLSPPTLPHYPVNHPSVAAGRENPLILQKSAQNRYSSSLVSPTPVNPVCPVTYYDTPSVLQPSSGAPQATSPSSIKKHQNNEKTEKEDDETRNASSNPAKVHFTIDAINSNTIIHAAPTATSDVRLVEVGMTTAALVNAANARSYYRTTHGYSKDALWAQKIPPAPSTQEDAFPLAQPLKTADGDDAAGAGNAQEKNTYALTKMADGPKQHVPLGSGNNASAHKLSGHVQFASSMAERSSQQTIKPGGEEGRVRSYAGRLNGGLELNDQEEWHEEQSSMTQEELAPLMWEIAELTIKTLADRICVFYREVHLAWDEYSKLYREKRGKLLAVLAAEWDSEIRVFRDREELMNWEMATSTHAHRNATVTQLRFECWGLGNSLDDEETRGGSLVLPGPISRLLRALPISGPLKVADYAVGTSKEAMRCAVYCFGFIQYYAQRQLHNSAASSPESPSLERNPNRFADFIV